MAIVFISTKRKQKVFFWGITLLMVLGLALIFSLAAFGEFQASQNVTVQGVFSAPNIEIDFSPIDSPQVKNLEPFLPATPQNADNNRGNPFVPGIIKK